MRSLTSSLLTLLLLWHLGACPCGCLEHNAWVELFVALEGEGIEESGGVGEISSEAWVLERVPTISPFALARPHCEGSGRPVYTLSEPDRHLRLRDWHKGCPAELYALRPSNSDFRVFPASAMRVSGVNSIHFGDSRRLAELQVWRI
jgi:hypothetical protein